MQLLQQRKLNFFTSNSNFKLFFCTIPYFNNLFLLSYHVSGEVSSESTSSHNIASAIGIAGRGVIEAGVVGLNQTSVAAVELSLAAAGRLISTTAPTASSPQAPITVAPNAHAHLSAAVTPRPPRGRKRQLNHNGIDVPPVCILYI